MNKFILKMIIGYIFMIFATIFLMLDRFFPKPSILNLNLFLILSLITWIIGGVLFFTAFFKDVNFKPKNVLDTWDFSYRYCSKVGYALFTGGIVTLFTSTYWQNSIILMIIGITLAVVGEKSYHNIKKFKTVTSK